VIDANIHGFDASGPAGNMNATRHFATAAQLREEIVDARLWAGLHYRGSSDASLDLGRKVAHHDLNHVFSQPVKSIVREGSRSGSSSLIPR
jgi:hypothetical protein